MLPLTRRGFGQGLVLGASLLFLVISGTTGGEQPPACAGHQKSEAQTTPTPGNRSDPGGWWASADDVVAAPTGPRATAAPTGRTARVAPARRSRIRDFFVGRTRWTQQPPATAPIAAGSATSADQPGAPAAIAEIGTPGAPETSVVEPPPPGAQAPGVVPTLPAAPTPLTLNQALGLADSPTRVYGWLDNSFTGNANGMPRNRENFGVYPNHLANQWMGNQYYLTIENPLNTTDTVNFGFRFDMLFGNDWEFTKDYGLFDHAFPNNHFAGLDLPQIYGEVHLPILTPLGLDIRAGRFYSLTGFESPQAIARPLLSVPYSMNYTPFTFFGGYANLHVHRRLNLFSGTIDGFDRWPNEPYKWGYMGGMTWTSRNEKLNIVIGGASAYDQLPIFPPANATNLPVGVPGPGFLPGRPNPFYNKSMRGYLVAVATYKWTSKLTQAVETDDVWDPQILGFGGHPYRPTEASYHGFVNWFLYQLTPKLTAVWRSEIFWDPYGLATGNADNYHEMTVGLVYKPREDIWIRPEARYDWAEFTHPYSDGTRNSQLTLAFDVIFLF
ncbi:MAG: outer membrane beta-barrel protein [Isosphaeraceae bacterium]